MEIARTIRTMPLTAMLGVAVILVYGVVAILAPLIAPHGQATILGAQFEPWGSAYPLGTDALAEQLADAGFDPVRTLEDSPAVVVQGYHPAVAWSLLELGAIAIQQGATWYATNPDMTRPTERGLLPGCGSQVAVVQACVEQEPRVAGKPFRPLLDETVLRLQAKHPIFVGDRIDTDIMGANAVGMDSLFVFTGAHGKHDLATAGPDGRPTHISWGTEGLLSQPRAAQITADGGSCQGQAITVSEGVAHAASIPAGRAEQLDLLWVALQLAWDHEIQVEGILESLDELP